MPFLVFGIRRPLRGSRIARCIPGFRFASPGAIFRRPLRGLILFTVDACAGFQQHSITPLPQVDARRLAQLESALLFKLSSRS